jgi:thiamine biosynthesis lipoprotein
LIDRAARLIRLARPAMAITANGIAQGYLTDRITERLRAAGAGHVLLNLGEIRALGRRGDGQPWCVSLEHGRVELADRAIATTDPAGTTFAGDRRQHHLFDPRAGRPARVARRVTVTAPTATLADALSTAYSISTPEAAKRLQAGFPEATLAS